MLNFASGTSVDWASIVGALKSCGWSQKAVAEALGCSQGTISQLNTGRHADPAYSLGVRLLALHGTVLAEAASADAPDPAAIRHAALQSIARRFPNSQPASFDGFPEAADLHVSGDTTTPPAPGAVWIGSGDA